MQQRILQHTRVTRTEHEPVTARPAWILRVDSQTTKERIAQRCERHRGAGMSRASLLDHVHCQPTNRVDRQPLLIAFVHLSRLPADLCPQSLRPAGISAAQSGGGISLELADPGVARLDSGTHEPWPAATPIRAYRAAHVAHCTGGPPTGRPTPRQNRRSRQPRKSHRLG